MKGINCILAGLLLLVAAASYGQDKHIEVIASDQQLKLYESGKVVQTWPVSTSAYGLGSEAGSNKTPLGKHVISEKYGVGAEPGTIFKARMNTGRKATIYYDNTDVEKDEVTTRVLWLTGTEPGKNKGGNVDSHSRYIYIHGTPEEGLIGRPASHGCIRMKNADVIELFQRVDSGTPVEIKE